MPIVVLHKPTEKHYILVGTSYSYFKDSRPSAFGGTLFPHEEEGEFEMAAVCDENGKITWLESRELIVIGIDKFSPSEILQNYKKSGETVNDDTLEECPGCGFQVKSTDAVCPSCGLTLISS